MATRKPESADKSAETKKTDVSEDQLQALFFQGKTDYQRGLAAKKKADADFKAVCRRLKAEIGKTAIADIKTSIELDTEEGEAKVRARIEDDLRVMRWSGVALGETGRLFPDVDPAPLDEHAFNAGKRDGMAGNPRNNPHHHTISAHQKYEDGFLKGQELLGQAGFKATPKEAPAGALGDQPATHEVTSH